MHFFNRRSNKTFSNFLGNVKEVQTQKLKKLFLLAQGSEFGQRHNISPEWSWGELQKNLPISDYSTLMADVNALKKIPQKKALTTSPIKRFQLTSGTIDKCKWIPYTQEILGEFDNAVGAWLYDLATEIPGILDGKHYWSLSWVPENLRREVSSDDTELLPWWKQFIFNRTMAVPAEVSTLPSFKDARLATLTYLCACQDLSLLSIWSPTFLLSLLSDLQRNKVLISRSLLQGKWASPSLLKSSLICPQNKNAARILRTLGTSVDADFLKELWPKLALISAWGSSTSFIYAQDVKKLFPHVYFQNKGLWATEGVVTIPFRGRNLLAITSHAYEFRCQQTQKIYLPWELELGQIVQPLLTTGAGFFRYALPDQMEVTGFEQQCPALEFKGRISGCDMVGEKLDPVLVSGILSKVSQKTDGRAISLLGSRSDHTTKYFVLIEGNEGSDKNAEIANLIEEELQQVFHYKLARDLGQLEAVRPLATKNATDFFETQGLSKSPIAGNQKVEPLMLCDL